MPDTNVKVDSWKQSLLDSSDPLLDLSGAAVPIAGDPIRLAFVLGAGGGLELEADKSFELVTSLKRRARAAEADGDHVIWLGLGLLRWARGRIAPIVLWPVSLAADGRLVHAEGRAPRVNDVLAHALRIDHESILETTGELDLAAVLRNAGAVADAQPDWGVERAARLVTCSFAKFELWRDATAHDLAASPAIAYFTGASTAPALPAASSFDVIAPLDADASQLAAIAAAGAGGSFVVHGAPGTGKSQTIANLVVHCASNGKTVLVVADREPALDTIYDQLVALGLGEFCLPLHGEHGSPLRALDSLGRAVDRAFRPGSGPSGELARLGELRGALDAHRHAMHGKTPIGVTVYDVLARLVELRTTPCAALAEHDAPAHDRTRFQQRLAAVTSFADAAKAVEPVAAHPWRASEFTTWHESGVTRARIALEQSRDAAAALHSAVADVAALVPGVIAKTPDQLRALGTLCDLAAASPRPGAELLTNPRSLHEDVSERVALVRARGGGVLDTPREPGELLAIAARQRALAAELDETFSDAVAALDVGTLWTQLKRWTTSMAALRYVALRAVRAEVRAAALPGEAETDEAMLVALECAIAERACRAALEAAAEPARRWFGDLGKGAPLALDLAAIDAAVAWGAELKRAFDRVEVSGGEAGRRAAWRALVAQVASSSSDAAADARPFASVAEAVGRWDTALTELAAACGLRSDQLGAGNDHLPSLRNQIAMLLDAADAIADWARFDLARRAATVAGVGPAIGLIERGDLAADAVAGSWERATLLAWLETEMHGVPALARFVGQVQHERAAAFVDVDRGSHALARTRAIARLAERAPRMSRLAGLDEDAELNALRKARAEAKPRPLSALLAEMPSLLGKIAPCVLATPRALAQHLAPGMPMFDVVVFDDASRIPAAFAMGALARGKAAVVFGDAQQCAPASGTEGLFTAALAAGMPALTLGAHYRSRHEDLFAFANRRYYDTKIEQRPAPHAGGMGLAWLRVEGAPDDAGANRVEAEAIVAEVVARYADPVRRSRSLAIAVMARAQEELIEELLAAAKLPADRGAIVVATPDRLQGLEVDDAMVSLGGTPEAFGALALSGGDAWLAVATTRAREKMTIVASFEPEMIAADAPAAVRSLAELATFARAGGGAARPVEGGTPVTAITAAVARALGERGWTVHHGVGVGPYRIALAVVDPADASRYVLAIEDDGPAYANAGGARDRDRLRVQELTKLGWRVHRMWALDWWNDAEREIQRAHGSIVAAIAAQRARTLQPTVPPARERRLARGSLSAPTRAPVMTTLPRRRAATPSLSPSRAPLQLPLLAPPDTAPMAMPVEVAAGSGPNDLDPSDTAAVAMVPAGAGDITARAPLATAAAAAATAMGSSPTAVPATDAGAADTAEIAAADANALAAGMMMPLEASASAPLKLPRGAIAIGPYIAAAIPAGRRAPDDMFAARHLAELGKVVEKVLAAEAPIHVELLARRVGAYFGIGKIDERILQQVRGVLAGRGRYGDEAGVVWRLDQDPASVPSVRVTANAGFRRAIGEVPLAEVAAAARIVVERGHDVAATDLVRDCARLLGFARITDQVTARVQLGVRLATLRELIAVDAGRARMPS